MRSERTPRARRYGATFVFLLSGTVAGVWHNRATETGRTDPVSAVMREAIAPPTHLVGGLSRWISQQTGWLFHGHAVSEENRRLRDQVAALQAENARLQEAQINYDRLRGDLGFVQANRGQLLATDVLWRRPDPKFDTLVIGAGTRSGVHVRSVVVTRGGLVGQVYEVTPNTASVVMITDGSQNSPGVGARIQRATSRAVGVCKGDLSSTVSLLYLKNDDDVKKGDVVVTSGMGGVFPPGLLIGSVEDVRADEGNLSKRAHIRPTVDFDRLEEVYVLK